VAAALAGGRRRVDEAAMDLATTVSDTGGVAADYVNHGHDDGKKQFVV